MPIGKNPSWDCSHDVEILHCQPDVVDLRKQHGCLDTDHNENTFLYVGYRRG